MSANRSSASPSSSDLRVDVDLVHKSEREFSQARDRLELLLRGMRETNDLLAELCGAEPAIANQMSELTRDFQQKAKAYELEIKKGTPKNPEKVKEDFLKKTESIEAEITSAWTLVRETVEKILATKAQLETARENIARTSNKIEELTPKEGHLLEVSARKNRERQMSDYQKFLASARQKLESKTVQLKELQTKKPEILANEKGRTLNEMLETTRTAISRLDIATIEDEPLVFIEKKPDANERVSEAVEIPQKILETIKQLEDMYDGIADVSFERVIRKLGEGAFDTNEAEFEFSKNMKNEITKTEGYEILCGLMTQAYQIVHDSLSPDFETSLAQLQEIIDTFESNVIRSNEDLEKTAEEYFKKVKQLADMNKNGTKRTPRVIKKKANLRVDFRDCALAGVRSEFLQSHFIQIKRIHMLLSPVKSATHFLRKLFRK